MPNGAKPKKTKSSLVNIYWRASEQEEALLPLLTLGGRGSNMSIDPSAAMAFRDEDASSGSGEDGHLLLDGHSKRQPSTPSTSAHRKRSRKTTGDAIVDAMLEIAAASKMRAAAIVKNEERFSISKCIQALDEMQGVDQRLYFLALDLFENPVPREIFLSLKSGKRLLWLQDNSARGHDFELILDEMELVAAAAGYYYYNSVTKLPRKFSSPSETNCMTEVLSGSDSVFRESLRMDKNVFNKLCTILRNRGMLRDTLGVVIEEQVAIFLNIIGHNERNRVVQERFQHSGETISRYFNYVLKAIKSLSREFLQPPVIATAQQILESHRFYPYFKDCIGIIDALHIPAHVPSKDQARFRNRKGLISQNVLVACTFDLQFIFVYPGWEGSAADSRVLRAVLNDPEQNFPSITEGKYYLVDAAYPNVGGFMAPYPGVRSYLQQFRGANQLPRNSKELFNHRHSYLRNAIHRSFDVLKNRFPILKVAPQYGFHVQRDIVIAASVLHNLVRREERKDWLFASVEGVTVNDLPDADEQPEMQLGSSMQQHDAFCLRDSMAAAMWSEFLNQWDEW